MKRIIYLLLILIISSCSKYETDIIPYNDTIIYTTIKIVINLTPLKHKDSIMDVTYNGMLINKCDTVIFNGIGNKNIIFTTTLFQKKSDILKYENFFFEGELNSNKEVYMQYYVYVENKLKVKRSTGCTFNKHSLKTSFTILN